AIGAGARADRGNAVSVGTAGAERQIIYVADATQATDAVNLRQLNAAIAGVGSGGGSTDLTPVAEALGGGASYVAGSGFSGPGYEIDGNTFDNVGDALTYLDGQIGSGAGGGGLTEAEATAIAAAGDTTTLAAANTYTDQQIANIGEIATADVREYADQGDATTLASANAYTDNRFAAWSDSFTQLQRDVDQRFARTDARIDRMGALGSAMAAAAVNTTGLPGRNRVGVGFGAQGGHSAMAVSYQRLVRSNASVSIGGAFSGNERSVSAGAGFSW
ncbi:MAG TPA: YadA-like family protein, partial [Pseudoxanthomonas sp.]|nr:YadA-like family protein [Pseudoxanthomonas sp.]